MHPLSAFDADLAGRFQRAAHIGYAMDWAGVERRAGELALGRRWKRKPHRALALRRCACGRSLEQRRPQSGSTASSSTILSADRAPETVQVDFGAFDRLDPARGPGIATNEARTVHTFRLASGTYDLTVAPAATGFCWGISRFGLTCENAALSSDRPLLP